MSVRVRLGAPCVADARGDQLILLTDGLGVGLAIRIKHDLAAIQPRRLKLERGGVPVGPAPARNLAHVLAKFFQRRAAEEPVAVVDLVDHQARLKNDHVGIIGVVRGIGVLRNVQILLHLRPASDKNGRWAPTPVRYSLVSVMLSVLIVTNLQ